MNQFADSLIGYGMCNGCGVFDGEPHTDWCTRSPNMKNLEAVCRLDDGSEYTCELPPYRKSIGWPDFLTFDGMVFAYNPHTNGEYRQMAAETPLKMFKTKDAVTVVA